MKSYLPMASTRSWHGAQGPVSKTRGGPMMEKIPKEKPYLCKRDGITLRESRNDPNVVSGLRSKDTPPPGRTIWRRSPEKRCTGNGWPSLWASRGRPINPGPSDVQAVEAGTCPLLASWGRATFPAGPGAAKRDHGLQRRAWEGQDLPSVKSEDCPTWTPEFHPHAFLRACREGPCLFVYL